MIFHLTTPDQWQTAQAIGIYQTDSLQTEGFIHASTLNQVITVANAFYRSQKTLTLLCIDPDRLVAPVKWETPAHPISTDSRQLDEEIFPHIYGTINLDAIQRAIAFSSDEEGYFHLPNEHLS